MPAEPAHRYVAFGLAVDSPRPFPELAERDGDADADVVVRFDPVEVPADAADGTLFHRDPMDVTIYYEGCRLRVRDGAEIVVDADPGVAETMVRWVVVGPGFNYLLHQRDAAVLHASTVDVGGRAVAFLGETGAGKSTTAAACHAAGHRILSDDVAAVFVGDGGARVQPGFPAVKVAAATRDRFAPDLAPVEGSSPVGSRRYYRLPTDRREPIPLAGVYLLEDGDGVELDRLAPAAAAAQLARNTYTATVFRDVAEATSGLDRAAALAGAVDVSVLARPRRFDALPSVVDAVEADVTAVGDAAAEEGAAP